MKKQGEKFTKEVIMFKGDYKSVKKLVKTVLEEKISVLLLGHPGCGKSTMAKELAQEFGLPLEEIRLAQRDPYDIAGGWVPERENKKLMHYISEWAPIEEPKFLFLDEFNAAITKLHQAAAYEIILDRKIGGYRFHEDTRIMAAGNLEEDNAIVSSLSSALLNRLAIFQLEPDVDTWLEWAKRSGISPITRAYISFRGIKGLYNYIPDQKTFPTPRSIAMADKLFQAGIRKSMKDHEIKGLLTSVIGEGDAVQYVAFWKVYKDIDALHVIKTGEVPQNREPSFLYALTYSIATHVEKMKAKEILNYKHSILKFLKKIPHEYVVLFIREVSNHEVFSILSEVMQQDQDFKRVINEIIDSLTF